jgi:hypothetical protein
MAGLAKQSHIATWIIIEDNANVRFAFVILLDALNRCNLPVQRNIQNISAFVWEEAHAVARSYLHA